MSSDEATYTMTKMLRELPKDVFSVWSEQYGEVERMVPECGSYAAALDAYEASHPDAA